MPLKGWTVMKIMKKVPALLVVLLLALVSLGASVSASEAESVETPAGQEPVVGIISAMDNELALLLEKADIERVDRVGQLDFHIGTLNGVRVILTRSGIGKVHAAAGAAYLLEGYHPTHILFTGIAGGVGDETKVLDVVVAKDLVQHDFVYIRQDGFEWSADMAGNVGYIPCDPELIQLARDCAVSVVGEEHVFEGTIATGDQFVASDSYVKYLQEQFNAIACEMEGAAVALVCSEYGVPFVVIRSMSGKADGIARETYDNMEDLAADQSSRIVMEMLDKLAQ